MLSKARKEQAYLDMGQSKNSPVTIECSKSQQSSHISPIRRFFQAPKWRTVSQPASQPASQVLHHLISCLWELMPAGLLIPSTQRAVASDPELAADLKPSRSDQVGMILLLVSCLAHPKGREEVAQVQVDEWMEQHCHLVAANKPRHNWRRTRRWELGVCTFCWIIAEGKWFGRGLISGFISKGLFSPGTHNYNCSNDHLLPHMIPFVQKCWHSPLTVVILWQMIVFLVAGVFSGDQDTCVRERPSE